ncbi:MAG: hypothetical protein KJO07_25450, partial [Deltaproteobacteria bacterium]|nr:hypothetical protein [Deltaproteobacteria bacterium]
CMAVYGQAGDRLWLPAELDPGRLGRLLRDPDVELVSGAIPDDADQVLAWGLTEEAVRAGADGDPSLVAELNDRRASLAMEEPLDPALAVPGPRVLESMDEFREAMGSWPHPEPWILKSPLSASGRARIKRSGAPASDAQARARRLFDRFGVMILEPWLDRIADYGTTATVVDGECRAAACHRMENDGHGVFRWARLGDPVPPSFLQKARAVGEELGRRGYRGPYSVDGFEYRTPVGSAARTLCEINVRHSFGHIARALVRRFRDQLGDGKWQLEIVRRRPVTEGAIELVRPCQADPTAVTLSRWA